MYLRFTNLVSYCGFLRSLGIGVTHFDVADVSLGPRLIYAAIATQRIVIPQPCGIDGSTVTGSTAPPPPPIDYLAIFYEVIYGEPEKRSATPRTEARRLKKAENAIWQTFSNRERAVTSAGLTIIRGILTPHPPEILARAK